MGQLKIRFSEQIDTPARGVNDSDVMQKYDVDAVLDGMGKRYDNKRGSIKKYSDFITKNVSYRIVQAYKRNAMTNSEIWEVIKSYKEEAV